MTIQTANKKHTTFSNNFFKYNLRLLMSTLWVSTFLFGLYIIAFYLCALLLGDLASWNQHLPGLYENGDRQSIPAISTHFTGGAIILMLGCIQLLPVIRQRYLKLHRMLGKVYLLACLATAIGGLLFIAIKGTIGGWVMDIGFSLYGLLMLVAVYFTFYHIKKGRIDLHQKWAVRLFALAIGSWIYRMDYGFWYLLTDNWGHNAQFTGPFDKVMSFFFFIPNLLLVELIFTIKHQSHSKALVVFANACTLFASGFVLLGIYAFTKLFWGAAILAMIGLA